jgi:hypothetical protein
LSLSQWKQTPSNAEDLVEVGRFDGTLVVHHLPLGQIVTILEPHGDRRDGP